MHGRVLDLVEDRKLMPAVYLIRRYESAEEIVQSAAHVVTCIADEDAPAPNRQGFVLMKDHGVRLVNGVEPGFDPP
jgi:hypothetical protein